jgi:hypothetical protein
MKTPHLLACLAVAATASAADLKDPSAVAQQMNRAAESTVPFMEKPDLRVEIPKPTPHPRAFTSTPKRKKQDIFPPMVPRERIYDAPDYRPPETLPDNLPPGSKLWRYGGQDYWLIPLIPSRDK